MKEIKPYLSGSSRQKSAGFGLVELTVTLGILSIIGVTLVTHMNMVKDALRSVEKGQTLDALELQMLSILPRGDVLIYSAEKTKKPGFVKCVKQDGDCTHGRTYKVPFYIIGQKDPITGAGAFYNKDGDLCPASDVSCRAFQIDTNVIVRCRSGHSVCNPYHSLTVKYEMLSITGKSTKSLRVNYFESVADKEFSAAKLNLHCPAGQVMKGVGWGKKTALCVPLSDVVLVDGGNNLSELKVTPNDCSALNKDKSEQHFVSSIANDGVINCAPRFW